MLVISPGVSRGREETNLIPYATFCCYILLLTSLFVYSCAKMNAISLLKESLSHLLTVPYE